SRAAFVTMFAAISARPYSITPRLTVRNTGKTRAISTAATPRRSCFDWDGLRRIWLFSSIVREVSLKSEIRTSKSERNLKSEIQKHPEPSTFGYLDLGFPSNFGFRISRFYSTNRGEVKYVSDVMLICPVTTAGELKGAGWTATLFGLPV